MYKTAEFLQLVLVRKLENNLYLKINFFYNLFMNSMMKKTICNFKFQPVLFFLFQITTNKKYCFNHY